MQGLFLKLEAGEFDKKEIRIEVKWNYSLTDQEFLEELLLAETRLNSGGKLRFHIISESSF